MTTPIGHRFVQIAARWTMAMAAVCLPTVLEAQSAPPGTDIYLAPLVVRGTDVSIGTPVNITARAGYDNQPSFTPDNRSILFTSVRDDGQADIYRYDMSSKRTTRVTATSESEYSPTVMPSGKRFSAIRVEKDSTQRLWSFALDGSDPQVILPALKPVGYHAWLDDGSLVMFVLGNPNALVHGDPRTQRVDTLARRIGRSLARIPNARAFSFTQTIDSTSTLWLRAHEWPGTTVSDLVALPRGTQDIAWLSRDLVLAGSGSTLRLWRRGTPAWTTIAEFDRGGPNQITRLAVSSDGKWIAIVGNDAP